MSDRNKLDDHLKEFFGNYSPDVPPHIWGKIVAGRKRKKPVVFWLNKKNILGLLALLIIVTGTGLLVTKKDDSKIIAPENKVSSSNAGTETAVPAAALKDNTTLNRTGINSTTITANKKEPSQSTENNNLPSANSNQNLSVSTPANKSEKINAAFNNSKEIVADKNLEVDKKRNVINQQQTIIKKKAKGKFTVQSSAIETAEAVDEKDNDAAAPKQEGFSMQRLLYGAEKISAFSMLDLNSKKTDFKTIQIPGCPADKDAAGNKQYWELYAGPDYAFKKYNDTANSALLEKRKASTSFQYAFSAGVRYTRVFSNGMSLRGGINYSQINEKFSYAQSNVVQLTYEINQQGDTINSYYVRGTKYRTSYNHYRTLDIPLLVGYELGNGRLHANINAGAVINIYSWQNGETLDTTFTPVSFTSAKSNSPYQYKTNVGVGFMGGISFYYKLNESLHLLAEPYYRYNFSPMNKGTLSIQERFSTIGLRLGLRLDL